MTSGHARAHSTFLPEVSKLALCLAQCYFSCTLLVLLTFFPCCYESASLGAVRQMKGNRTRHSARHHSTHSNTSHKILSSQELLEVPSLPFTGLRWPLGEETGLQGSSVTSGITQEAGSPLSSQWGPSLTLPAMCPPAWPAEEGGANVMGSCDFLLIRRDVKISLTYPGPA